MVSKFWKNYNSGDAYDGYITEDNKLRKHASIISNILNSLSEARRALKENSVYINKSRVDENKILNVNDLIIEGVILVQRGKKRYLILDFTD